MKALLTKYVGKYIGLNADNSIEYESVKLYALKDGYFTIRGSVSNNLVHYPYDQITSVVENAESGGFAYKMEILVQVKSRQIGQFPK
jgi:hypothetical protein|uniref:hypothetical protein n=1 Tax=Cephaloticoccus sp. TaxID=1985742 RepID=UPI00404B0211